MSLGLVKVIAVVSTYITLYQIISKNLAAVRERCRVTLQTLLQAKVIFILLILYMDVNNYTLIFLLDECYTAAVILVLDECILV